MKLEQLGLENFMGWSTITVDLSKYRGVVAILGSIEADMSHSNGTGKSSLINAINYALYGTAVGKNLDGMIRQGAEGFVVTLRFEHGGNHYEIVRKKKTGAVQKVTFKDLTNKKPMSITPEEFFGMPEVVWQNTAYSAQRNLSGFVDKSPSQRKDILTEIFGMDNYLELEGKVRTTANKADAELTSLGVLRGGLLGRKSGYTATPADVEQLTAAITSTELQVANYTTRLADVTKQIHDIDVSCAQYTAAAQALKELESQHALATSRFAQSSARAEATLAELDHEIEQLTAAVAEPVDLTMVPQLQGQIQAAEDQRPALAAAEAQQSTTQREHIQATADIRHLSATIANLNKKLLSIPKGTCFSCGQAITEEHTHSVTNGIQEEINQAAAEQAVLEERVKVLDINLQNSIGEVRRLQGVIATIPALSRQIISAQQRADAHAASVKRLQELSNAHTNTVALSSELERDAQAEIARLAAEIAAKRAALPVVDDLTKKKTELEATQRELNSGLLCFPAGLKELRQKLDLATFQLQEKAKIDAELATTEAALDSVKMQRDTYTELVKAFGPNGIPTLILENCLSELQQYLDHYMGILSDGKIRVTFQTVKTNAAATKTTETLNIRVSDVNGERDIELYSGGETVRMYLAIRLALAKLLYLKSGQRFGLMVIDEIADLDDAGLMAFTDLLKRIEPEYEQILLVSHIPELKTAFDNALVLTRDIEGNFVTT